MPSSVTVADRLLDKKKTMKRERKGKLIVYTCAALIILTTLAITTFLVIRGLQAFVIDGVNPIHFF